MTLHPKRAKDFPLIAIEGIDGSGKSTLVSSLRQDQYGQWRCSALFYTELKSSIPGRLISRLYYPSKQTRAFQLFDAITPLKALLFGLNGRLILSPAKGASRSRFFLSDRSPLTLYAMFGNCLGSKKISHLYLDVIAGPVVPDLVILLDLEPLAALARLRRPAPNETPDRLKNVRSAYSSLTCPQYRPRRFSATVFHTLPADRPIKDVQRDSYKLISSFLERWELQA